MTKEELEKEATEFEENYTVYEVAKREDGTDYAKKICKVTIKEVYLAAAEPREKEIISLNTQLDDSENLRIFWKEQCFEWQTKLTKAKEILQLFLDANTDLDMINAQRRASAFLKEQIWK